MLLASEASGSYNTRRPQPERRVFSRRSDLKRARHIGRALTLAVLLAGLLFGLGGCRRKPKVATAPPGPPPIGEPETGLASWYGHPYHGRQTASGEIYDMNQMTAAHRTLPFQTWVRVTNLENQMVTTVRINDRGPFIEGRIIDLSRAGAEAIDMVGPGTALVRVEVVQYAGGGVAPPGAYAVQVGAFLVEENAMRMQARLAPRYGDVFIQSFQAPDGLYYRVRVGRVNTLDEALALADELRRQPEIAVALVVRLD